MFSMADNVFLCMVNDRAEFSQHTTRVEQPEWKYDSFVKIVKIFSSFITNKKISKIYCQILHL